MIYISLPIIIAISFIIKDILKDSHPIHSAIHLIYGSLCTGTTTALRTAASVIGESVVSLDQMKSPISFIDDIHGIQRNVLCEYAWENTRPDILAAAKCPAFTANPDNQQLLTRLIQWTEDEWKELLYPNVSSSDLHRKIVECITQKDRLSDLYSVAVSFLEEEAEDDPVFDALIEPFALLLCSAYYLEETLYEDDDSDVHTCALVPIILNKMNEIRSQAANLKCHTNEEVSNDGIL